MLSEEIAKLEQENHHLRELLCITELKTITQRTVAEIEDKDILAKVYTFTKYIKNAVEESRKPDIQSE